jgi:hypothetical protein
MTAAAPTDEFAKALGKRSISLTNGIPPENKAFLQQLPPDPAAVEIHVLLVHKPPQVNEYS